MLKVDSILNKLNLGIREISLAMQKHKFTNLIYHILAGIGLNNLKHYLFGLWFHRHPTQAMKDYGKIFLEHAQELKAVYDSLEDDESRFVFKNILKYRVTFDWIYLKRAKLRGDKGKSVQYFVSELHFLDHEIIVDCGAYTGDMVQLFYKNIPGCRVIALEPEEKNYESLQKLKLEGLMAIKAGAWSEDTILSFSDQGSGTSVGAIDTYGNTKIDVKALDHLPECQSATYIKMDIEGAELEALKGAEKIIKREKPKLAICIYHKPQDFFEIPLYIKKINPDYKLYIYHHSYHTYDTVLYAV